MLTLVFVLLLANGFDALPRESADSDMFAKVVQYVRDSNLVAMPLAVSPFPLRADASIADGAFADRAQVPDSMVTQRRSVLESFAIATADSATAGLCAGVESWERTFDHCPTQSVRRAAIGLPRVGGAWLKTSEGQLPPPSAIDASGNTMSVRVIQVELGPHGSFTRIGDAVFRRNGEAWVFTKFVRLAWLE